MLIPYIFTHAYTHAPLPPHMHTFTVLLPEAHGPDALSLSQPSPLLLPTQEWHVAQIHPAHPGPGVLLQVRLSGRPDEGDETYSQAQHTHIQLLEAQEKSKFEDGMLLILPGGGGWIANILGWYLILFLLIKFRGIVGSIHSFYSCSRNTISPYCPTCPLRHHWRVSEQNWPQLEELGWVEMIVIFGSQVYLSLSLSLFLGSEWYWYGRIFYEDRSSKTKLGEGKQYFTFYFTLPP